jgi:hypothetical protein
MGMALNRAAFMRKARRFVASFIPFVLAVSTLSAISIVAAPRANAAYTVSNTNEVVTTTGGGGYITANCDTGAIIRTIGATGISPSNVLTRPTANCFTLNSAETLANVGANSLGGTSSWGTDAGNTTLTSVSCTESQGVVGIVAHKTASNGYMAGFQVICGDLFNSTNRTTSSVVFGWNNAGTSAIFVSVSGNDVTVSLDKFNDYSYPSYGTVVSLAPIVSVQAASQEYQNISISYP